jgi:hypothetical protein
MGIISDILESNRERVGQIFSAASPPSHYDSTLEPVKMAPCPLCASVLKNEAELQAHILSTHRRVQSYLKLDGEVLQDVHYVAGAIRSLLAITLGETDGTASIVLSTGESNVSRLTKGKPLELRSKIPAHYVGIVKIVVRVGRFEREFIIYCRTVPTLNTSILDAAVAQLQTMLTRGVEPHWSAFQREYLHNPRRDVLEKRYLEGFYSYILGAYLEMEQKPEAGRHFEDAYGRLRPFSTNLAHTARCLLALKMNWFQILQVCGPTSQFFGANAFFNEPSTNTKKVSEAPAPRFDSAFGLWVDPFTETLLAAIGAFLSGRWSTVHEHLQEMKDSVLARDRNNSDKVTLLEARLYLATENPRACRRAYTLLQHHPIFGREADTYLRTT